VRHDGHDAGWHTTHTESSQQQVREPQVQYTCKRKSVLEVASKGAKQLWHAQHASHALHRSCNTRTPRVGQATRTVSGTTHSRSCPSMPVAML
jgi:hypothetical protein